MHLVQHLSPRSPSHRVSAGVPLVVAEVPSSDGTHSYTVVQLPDGRWSCPCKGFAYRETCRHIKQAKEVML